MAEGDVRVAAAVDFARHLRQPEFRAGLKRLGWQSGQAVLIALDDELLGDMLGRAITECDPPVYVAVPRPSEDLAFAFMVLTPAGPGGPSGESFPLGPTTTVGMFIDSLRDMHRIRANQWFVAESVAC